MPLGSAPPLPKGRGIVAGPGALVEATPQEQNPSMAGHDWGGDKGGEAGKERDQQITALG